MKIQRKHLTEKQRQQIYYIGYVACMEDWCRHWAKDKEVKNGQNNG